MSNASNGAAWALLWCAWSASTLLSAETPQYSDWPQWRGPNRDGAALASPKLLDEWPKEGPPLVWKSEPIPGYEEAGCGSPVVADGKVFLYFNARQPIGGGKKFKPITTEALIDAGWLPDLPDELAKKIETARLARPATRGAPAWYDVEAPKDADIVAFIEKTPELNKYVKDFIGTLPPQDAQKYGAYIKRRFCMNGTEYTWDELVKMSTLRDTEIESIFEWNSKKTALLCGKDAWDGHQGVLGSFSKNVWMRACKPMDTILCLDAATGKTLWKKDFPADWTALKGRRGIPQGGFLEIGASGTPAVLDGMCFAAGMAGLYCLSAKDGSLLWQAKTEPAHASPLAANGIVYHYGSAYSANTGKVLWTNPAWKSSWAVWAKGKFISPALWVSQGRPCVISTDGNNAWCCLDLETGKSLWTFEGVPSEWSSPVVCGDILAAIMGSPTEVRAYKLSPDKAELLWKKPVGGWGTYTVAQNNLYVYSNIREFGPTTFYCLDLKTGEQKWTSPVYKNSEGGTSCPVTIDGKLINVISRPHGGHTFSLELLSANAAPGAEFTRLAEFDPKLCPLTSPALSGGALILRQNDVIACYNLRAP
ncbi:MAG: PQQ-like beta-propeller repeat protein [Planctomycetes bacterium]|nr:PQQ-like beta-propeller repeat protein [Planctomycetota bacterium]